MTVQELKRAHERNEPVKPFDPVQAHVPLPYVATFFPLGFPCRLETNSQDVLNAAAESWLGCARLLRRKPLRVRVLVQETPLTDCPPTPHIRACGHLLANIADNDTYSVVDLSQQFAMISVTRAALNHRSYFRYFFLESAVLCQIATRYATAIHAACVELDSKGVLLCGDSGAGKSTLSFACAEAGWTYVTDDASYLVHGRSDRLVVGNFKQVRFRPSASEIFPELEGLVPLRRGEAGKPTLEFATGHRPHFKRAGSSRIKYVVFLERNGGRTQQLMRFPRAVARDYLLQSALGLPQFGEGREEQIDQFFGLQPLELRYTDLAWAVDRLTRLVKDKAA